jgi:hypothetical protein
MHIICGGGYMYVRHMGHSLDVDCVCVCVCVFVYKVSV